MPTTKEKIAEAIRSLASGEDPFCTAAEIADWTGLSKVTVNNYISDVVSSNYEIKTRTVGQTPIYYTHYNRLSELPGGDDVIASGRLPDTGQTEASYYVLREAGEDSEFDAVVTWFNEAAEELEDYQPTPEEMGNALAGYGPDALAIKYYEDTEEAQL